MAGEAIRHAVAAMTLALSGQAWAQVAVEQPVAAPGRLTIRADKPGPVINRDIFGQFAEHPGTGIYGGVGAGGYDQHLCGAECSGCQTVRSEDRWQCADPASLAAFSCRCSP